MKTITINNTFFFFFMNVKGKSKDEVWGRVYVVEAECFFFPQVSLVILMGRFGFA